ncbi:hypothetical protein GALL_530720 [mine drainage metagenome]|uniref:Uncharacterized protein n=1 Tax=mine drainage metagenome TaxID=410659 RepID=A0A1J5P2T6_9ZZZZ
MGRCATVGIDNDLASGQTCIAHGAADDKPAGRIHQITHVLIQHFGRNDRLDDLFDHGFLYLRVRYIGMMLRGQHHGIDMLRPAIDVTYRNLRFRIGTQPWQTAILAQFGLTLDQTVRQVNRHRH